MLINNIPKRLLTVGTILFLLLSFSANVFAGWVTDNNDGIGFDDFSDSTSITLENCSPENGYIRLQKGSFNTVYDHEQKPTKVSAWEDERSLISPGGDFGSILSLYISPTMLPGDEFDNINSINKRDGVNELTLSEKWRLLEYTSYPMALFKFEIDEKVDNINKFDVNWFSGAYDPTSNVKSISMYLWAYGNLIPRWQHIRTILYNMANINKPDLEPTLWGSELASEYLNDAGELYLLIVATPDSATGEEQSKLLTDYVKVEINIKEGYLPEGNIISSPIPTTSTNIKGWESIFWDGSRPSSTTSIKVQVLDETGAVIQSLPGNSDGFTTSPIDLSMLSTGYTKIKLKATFYSNNLKYTPRLYSWGVLWQTKDGFYDSFTYNFRVNESYGVDIESGEVKISDFYSNWEIFGKNPQNTRSYFGPEVKLGVNKTYWHTNIEENIGGWFRSPVVSNGKVYIAADDTRIYSYNLTFESEYPEYKDQYPFDYSKANYFVESSLAVGNDQVIVATSEQNSDQNRIFALNCLNLSEELWSYPTPGNEDGTICFTAAPTIAKNRVFVTSWSGQFGNIPQVEYIYSKIDNMLRSILGTNLGVNNKLIALDLESGTPIWNPIQLPAGSFCTPAVDDGLIFVGLRNIQGPSLIAYNENTGEQVWNATLGRIDRASPVIAQGESEKIVIAISREQSLFSYQGEDIVTALSAETGEILWNMTISNQSSLTRLALLKLYAFKNTIATDGGAATPAVSGNTVFVVSPNGMLYALNINTGETIWSIDIKSQAGGLLPSYFTSSPVVIEDVLYIASQNAKIYALDANSGDVILEYPIEYEGFAMDIILNMYSSSVVTDGLILISALEPGYNIGHLICLGGYSKNAIGKIYSVPIYVQKGKWWDKFIAGYTNTSENTLKFSILDSNGNVILSNLDGKTNDLSGKVATDTIQLYAEFKIANQSQSVPVLYDWEVIQKTENTAPVFISGSFEPDPSGWIKNDTPICTIKVKDSFPGLDTTTAKFRLTYTTGNVSDWFTAECTGSKGSIQNETITADVSKVDIGSKKLKRIEISIEDLSGNMATYALGSDFKIDRLKPYSWIDNSLASTYNEPVEINANGTDSGDVNVSGIDSISVYYRFEADKDWVFYTSAKSQYDFEFERNVSGVYEICTIAQDKAGNSEDFPDEAIAIASFVLDLNPPNEPTWDEDENDAFNWIPEFTVDFSDDYKLKMVEYRLSNQANWININSEYIGTANYTGIWEITDEEWASLEEGVTYYVYFRVTDTADNIYETLSDDEALYFTIDTIPPGGDIIVDVSDFETTGKDKYTIKADVPVDSDIKFVSLEYSFSDNNDKWSSWKQFGDKLDDTPYEWEFETKEGSGYYRFKVLIWDNGKNSNESPIKKVTYTQFPAGYLSLLIILFIILLFLSIIIVKKLRAK